MVSGFIYKMRPGKTVRGPGRKGTVIFLKKQTRKSSLLLIGSLLFVILLTVFFVSCAPDAPTADTEKTGQETQPVEDVPGQIVAEGIRKISKFGNLKLNVSHADVLKVFEFGDILTVSFGSVSVDVPLGQAYSDVDSGCPGLFLMTDSGEEETELAVNMGNFAHDYGVAEKIEHEDKSYEWQYCDGMSADTVFTITLKEKAGYLEQFMIRSMVYTDLREEYPDLSDAEFANFRPIKVGEIGEGILYRSSSPINPRHNRSTFSDAAAADAGITVFIDLADNEAVISDREGFKGSYFATQKHAAAELSIDFTVAENAVKLEKLFRYMANTPGVYCIFCEEGKERTGITAALLECLMGAQYDEVAADYMQSYINYYGISPQDEVYRIILDGNLNKYFTMVFGADPETLDLQQAAGTYCKSLGLTDEEIASLQENLRGTR